MSDRETLTKFTAYAKSLRPTLPPIMEEVNSAVKVFASQLGAQARSFTGRTNMRSYVQFQLLKDGHIVDLFEVSCQGDDVCFHLKGELWSDTPKIDKGAWVEALLAVLEQETVQMSLHPLTVVEREL